MTRTVFAFLIISLSALASPSDADHIISKYYTDPLVVKRIAGSIKAVRFTQVSGFDAFKREGNTFTLIKSTKAIVTFHSSRLKNLFEELNNRDLFLNLLRRASAYGIESGTLSVRTENGESEELTVYEGRVLIILHGEGADEEFMVFFAGN